MIEKGDFNFFREDLEELWVDENIDPANRLRLSKKYCGIYMRNTRDSNEVVQLDDHFVVVDLEWSILD